MSAPTGRNTRPWLQIAIDTTDREKVQCLARWVGPYADIVEVGTLLLKSVGIRIIGEVRAICPQARILVDGKAPDVGGLEAGLILGAGADMMTVMANTTLATVRSAVQEARRRDKIVLADLIGVSDVLARSREMREVGLEWVALHRGTDEALSGQGRSEQHFGIINELAAMGLHVAVAGGVDLETCDVCVAHSVDILVVGRAITGAPAPEAAARAFRRRNNTLWPDPLPQ
jgi:3-hexulose-6-phosphate synthase